MKDFIILEPKSKDKDDNKFLNIFLCNKNIKEDYTEINFTNIIKFKYNDVLLIPVDILNTATQIMICISEGDINDNDQLNIFNYILNERNVESIDYYIYKWNNNNNSQSIENTAMIYGKLLAYIISSREIFKFQTISFLAIGAGSLVLKSCLSELSTAINSIIDATDIIQDIIIIDSKISFNFGQINDILSLKLIAGKLVNVYKDNEYKIELPKNLNVRLSCSIVGIDPSKYKIGDNDYFINCLPEIFNFDLVNDFKINKDNYIFNINNILKKIKEKIYNNYI
jgi:hypothetical protein